MGCAGQVSGSEARLPGFISQCQDVRVICDTPLIARVDKDDLAG